MSRIIFFSLLLTVLILIDFYVFQAIKTVTQHIAPSARRIIHAAFWVITIVSLLSILVSQIVGRDGLPPWFRTVFFSLVVIFYFSKIFAVLVLMIEDAVRFAQWAWQQLMGSSVAKDTTAAAEGITRSEFLSKAALIAAAVPAATMGYGIISGAHDYRVRRLRVVLPHLPAAFDGLRIGQLSDIHSGSFFNKIAVEGGIEMLLREKPDVVFFTGDLVNNETAEVKDYIDIFGKVKAPLGVFFYYGQPRLWRLSGMAFSRSQTAKF